MADLIERDEALKKIDTIRKAYMLHEPAGMGGMSAICICRDAVKEVPAVNRWIPCSERLQEVYEKVLTYNDEGIIHDNFRLNLRDGSVGWSQGWGITHWQPRPEPPKGGAEDGQSSSDA